MQSLPFKSPHIKRDHSLHPSPLCQVTMVLASAADMPKKPLSNISAPSMKPPWRAYITLPRAYHHG